MDAAPGTRVRIALGLTDHSLARALRDAGHEVVLAGAEPSSLAASVVQEDADLVVVAEEADVAEVARLLAERDAADVEVVVTARAVDRAAALARRPGDRATG